VSTSLSEHSLEKGYINAPWPGLALLLTSFAPRLSQVSILILQKSATSLPFSVSNSTMKTVCGSILLLASMALAADHVVLVGSSGLTFTPNELTAASGDTISFQFIKGVPHIQIQRRWNMLTSSRITQSHNQRSLIHANLMEASGLVSSQLPQPQPPAALQPQPPPVGPAVAPVTVIKWPSERTPKSLSSKSPSTRQPPSGSTALKPAIVKWVWFSLSMLMLRYTKPIYYPRSN